MKNQTNKEITIESKNRVRVRTINTEKSRTQQQFKEQCDVNNIIAKYKQTGEFVHLTRKAGVYADVSEITDYATSLQKVINADAAFAALPASIRLRFHNDPAQLLAFMQDPNNYDEGVQLGIFEKKQTPSMPDKQNKNDLNETKTTKGKRDHQKTNLESDKNSSTPASPE